MTNSLFMVPRLNYFCQREPPRSLMVFNSFLHGTVLPRFFFQEPAVANPIALLKIMVISRFFQYSKTVHNYSAFFQRVLILVVMNISLRCTRILSPSFKTAVGKEKP